MRKLIHFYHFHQGPRHIMKKTDTCYYMSITKEENSAFVVANNQSGTGAESTQVVVETKTDGTGNPNSGSHANANTNSTAMNSGTSAGTTTTTTTISTSCTIAGGDGNGTANKLHIDEHRGYSNSCNNALNETACRRQETTCTGPRGQEMHYMTPRAPQVILQVLPSTPTQLEHHNMLASDVHRECRMRLILSFFLSFFFNSFVIFSSLIILITWVCVQFRSPCAYFSYLHFLFIFTSVRGDIGEGWWQYVRYMLRWAIVWRKWGFVLIIESRMIVGFVDFMIVSYLSCILVKLIVKSLLS